MKHQVEQLFSLSNQAEGQSGLSLGTSYTPGQLSKDEPKAPCMLNMLYHGVASRALHYNF